jgi:hypothetical protein
MLWLPVVGLVVVLVLGALWVMLRIRRQRTGEMPLDLYRPMVAWRAAQCRSEIRAATAQVRRQLWAELDEIDRRERSGS